MHGAGGHYLGKGASGHYLGKGDGGHYLGKGAWVMVSVLLVSLLLQEEVMLGLWG